MTCSVLRWRSKIRLLCFRARLRGSWSRFLQVWLWRVVNQSDFVLDVLVWRHWNSKAANRLIRKHVKRQCLPSGDYHRRTAVYGAAMRGTMPAVEHRSHKGLNSQTESSHQPVRRRARIMKRFKSVRQLQRFVFIDDPIANLFNVHRHDIPSAHHREV
jgi:putative transposase